MAEVGSEASIASFQRLLMDWYKEQGRSFPWRRAEVSLYEHTIAEILLQRTTATAVARFLPLFVKRFANWGDLASASIADLGECLKPLGLWRRRASSLHGLAKEMVERAGRFPDSREELEQLPGVGQYIANAVYMFETGSPAPLLDSNMARVLERVFGPRDLADIRYDPYLQNLASQAVVGAWRPLDLNWAMLDLAALVCKRNGPGCSICPIAPICAYSQGTP